MKWEVCYCMSGDPAGEDDADDQTFKHAIVHMILTRDTEAALERLAQRYHIAPPGIRVGHWRGHKKVLAVYISNRRTIFVAKNEDMWNPFVILHEFYHHLRSRSGQHRGTEKLADAFALEYIRAYGELERRRMSSSTFHS